MRHYFGFRTPRCRWVTSLLAGTSLSLTLLTAALLTAAVATAENTKITMTAGKSVVIDSPGDVERVAVATEDVVEAVAITQREIVLNGKGPGETTVIIWQRNGGPRLTYDVTVEPSTLRIDALRRRLLNEVGESVSVEQDDKTVFLRGSVRNQVEGDRAMALAGSLGKAVSLLTMTAPAPEPQILLRVRFADVDRAASTALGVNIFSTGAGNTSGSLSTQQFTGPTPKQFDKTAQVFNLSDALNLFLFRPDLNLGATIKALEAKNLIQILAEPNVLATNGKQASFLAGGEFPYPVVQSGGGGTNNVTIMFREFGIRLNFTPTITARGTIRLEVAPEVSSLDYANGLTYSGFTIPGLSVRRVKTEIELENNQSFAIAGLIDNRVTENFSKIPGLGDVPLIGKLFQSKTVSRANSEILVVVTPELVQPIQAGGERPEIKMPMSFINEGKGTLQGGNVPDPRPLPAASQVPYVPSGEGAEKRPEGAAGIAGAAGALLNATPLSSPLSPRTAK